MPRAGRSSTLLVLGAGVAAVVGCGSLLQSFAFATPGRRAVLFGGLAASAGALSAQEAQAAEATKFGFFGFGGAVSDAYNQLDDNAYSPYSQFSGGDESLNSYKPYAPEYMAKKVKIVKESSKRIDNEIKVNLARRSSDDIKMEVTRQLGFVKAAMNYLVEGTPSKPQLKTINTNFQLNLEQFLVYVKNKNWNLAEETYGNMKQYMNEFKQTYGIDA